MPSIRPKVQKLKKKLDLLGSWEFHAMVVLRSKILMEVCIKDHTTGFLFSLFLSSFFPYTFTVFIDHISYKNKGRMFR